jgi:hypothetical protein
VRCLGDAEELTGSQANRPASGLYLHVPGNLIVAI